MNKRHIILAALALAVIVFSILGYFNINKDPVGISPFEAISKNASAVLTVKNYQRAYENLILINPMWQELLANEQLQLVNNNILKFDSILRSASEPEALSNMKFLISFYASGTTGIDHCFLLPSSTSEQDEYNALLQSISLQTEQYGTFEEVDIMKVKLKKEYFNLMYFAQVKNLLIVGFNPTMIEDAIRNIHSGENLGGYIDFNAVEKTTGEYADWNFFINYKEKAGLRFLGMNSDDLLKSDMNWSGWTALDVTLHPDLLLLNGFSNAGPNSYLSLFDLQKPQDVDVVDIIPRNVSLFFHFGVSNYGKYIESKKAYYKKIGRYESYKKKIDLLQKEQHFDIESELEKWMANEFGVMFIKHAAIESNDAKVAFYRLSDQRRAKSVLNRLHEEGLLNDESLGDQQLGIENIFDDVESDLFNEITKPHYAIVDKYLLLSSHVELIEHVKNEYEKGKTLKKSAFYSELSNNLSDQSNVYIYIHLKDGLGVYDDILDSKSKEFFTKHPQIVNRFEHLGLQFTDGKKNLFYQHTALNYHAKKRSEGNMLWEVALDTNVVMKPKIVYNHYSNAREVFVQDVGNKIYLIDNRGNIVWKRQLKEPIKSDVYQIDVYKNNKLQILFSGESSIYLIDRKGRDVERFPVQLPAVSTNGLTIIDYEKNREYRILVGVRGGKILNFDRFGNAIEGWNFKCDEEIYLPIKHFLLNGKDYITCVGNNGTPFVLDRRGGQRLNFKENLPPNMKDYRLELSNDISKCEFITSDESGNVVKMQFNGEKEILNFNQFSADHFLIYDDLNNDQKSDYIFLDSNKLMAFDHRKEKIFEVELEKANYSSPTFYNFSNGMGKIGISNIEDGNIYLYKKAGSLDKNFPLKGRGAFTISDINKDERFNLIVGLDKRLIVYNLE